MTDKIQEIKFDIDLTRPILWQYDSKPRILSLINQKNEYYQKIQYDFWNDWRDDVFSILTAESFGLVVWAIILGAPTNIFIRDEDQEIFWGFGEHNGGFDTSNFTNQSSPNVKLTVEQGRLFLLLRYNQLTGNSTVTFINEMLSRILGPTVGTVYVLDSLNMDYITYVMDFYPPSWLWFIFTQCNVLPRPSGIRYRFLLGDTANWGFGEHNENFDNGNFEISVYELG